MNPHLARHLDWFATLSPQTLADIDTVYTESATFRDPFQALHGRTAIAELYARMFRQLQAPRFVIGEVVAQGDKAFVCWDFSFVLLGRAQQIHGGTLLTLAADGRIAAHRDYWDAAEGVYEKLPLVGALLRVIKRRMA
ncbi:nuclear transport factor 2 family protein [Vogesella sp. LYT5W]|uniref:Nuclear transport factor 2 family protein n=1 Tax=Vogesella margarita TaxID=2984199 RepID=A0ABT5IJJ3_9NEIS|nr:nuclear transport factor 2 family protein [Vogesella margarita]MDC7712709.1 nuclear transport factor 2 family protein [Vogesella margarita]